LVQVIFILFEKYPGANPDSAASTEEIVGAEGLLGT
jgi:hypothetical protein